MTNDNNLPPVDPYSDDAPVEDPYASSTPNNSIGDAARGLPLQITPFSVVVFVLAAMFVGVIAWGITENKKDTIKEGEAPDFSLEVYSDTDIQFENINVQMDYSGETVKLSNFRDQIVVLNFWQSNCVPCHQEAEMLVDLYNEYRGRGVVFIGINAKDPDKDAFAYIRQYDINYPNGLDRGDRIQEDYRTTGYPETFVIDRDGNIQRHFAGPPGENALRAEIDKALEES
ncbi:MAG: TlpA family protein disulfide reductase [Chloroflexi bacterium]|nr:TlpA family protein disulfide reductase [Chloroflexota bacterium]